MCISVCGQQNRRLSSAHQAPPLRERENRHRMEVASPHPEAYNPLVLALSSSPAGRLAWLGFLCGALQYVQVDASQHWGQQSCASPALPDKTLLFQVPCLIPPELSAAGCRLQGAGTNTSVSGPYRSTGMCVASNCSLLSPLHGGYPVPGPCSGHERQPGGTQPQLRGKGQPRHPGAQADL